MVPMRPSALSFLLVALTLSAAAPEAAWLRHPALSPDGRTIVFTYRGDLYRVPSAGGAAVPLTTHEAHDTAPVWSPDGQWIAFASDRSGNFDLYVIPAAGGVARRLTWHSAPETPYAFTPDGTQVLFGAARQDAAAHRGYPASFQPELYAVPVAGGPVTQVLTTPAEAVCPSRDGRFLLYQDQKAGENPWRKHHTSSAARDLWRVDLREGTHTRLTTFAGEDRNPVLVDRDTAVVYLSEASGTFNVHRRPLAGGPEVQLTHFKQHPVRFLSASVDGTLCFGWDGAIYTQKGTAAPQRVPIILAVDPRGEDPRVVPLGTGLRELAVAPSGKEVATTFRGDVFVTAVEGGMTKRITTTPGAERDVAFTPDGQGLLYAAQREGRWAIYETRRQRADERHFHGATSLKEALLVGGTSDATQPKVSPDGRQLAYLEDHRRLKVMDLATKATRTMLTERDLFTQGEGGIEFAWSPDSRWVLFELSTPGLAPGEVGLVQADGRGPVHNLTRSGFDDGRPQWILGGKAVLWTSTRDGLKPVAQNGPTQQDAYALFLDRGAWDRFRLTKAELALVKEVEEKPDEKKDPKPEDKKGKAKGDPAKAKVEPLTLDLEDLETRRARLTLHSASLGDVLLSKDGETLYTLARFEKGLNLWATTLRTKEAKLLVTLNASQARMAWDPEQKALFLLADGTLSKVDPASAKREPIALAGEVALDVAAERRAMFEHVWRRTRRSFYTAGFHGADWDGLKAAYARHLPGISNNHEFAELLSELLGELNVSHCGASYTPANPLADATASLGLIYDGAHPGPGLKVAEVLKGGPLDTPGAGLRPGAVILALDGTPILGDRDGAAALNRLAGRRVLLTVQQEGKTLEVVAKPISLAEEGRLLYQRWVRRNREEVERLSGGRLGYVHIPGMHDGAYRTVFEEALGRHAQAEGLVVDTRNNGGGDLVADLAMFLSGKAFFTYGTDTRATGFEPNFRWTKPVISLANEANYSDGHCYTCMVQALGLGKLVGMPVPGTCSFAGWELLQDPTLRWGTVPVGVKNTAGQYLENRQSEPDLLVANTPETASAGRDLQLEAAVAELLRQLRSK